MVAARRENSRGRGKGGGRGQSLIPTDTISLGAHPRERVQNHKQYQHNSELLEFVFLWRLLLGELVWLANGTVCGITRLTHLNIILMIINSL